MNGTDRISARLFVDTALNVPTLGLDAPRTHYLRHVLRLEKGDRIALFNGRDGEVAARIEGFGKRAGAEQIEQGGIFGELAAEIDDAGVPGHGTVADPVTGLN